MAKQQSKNYLSDSGNGQFSDGENPFRDYDDDERFLKTMEGFKPRGRFETELLRGDLYRNGKIQHFRDSL